MKGEMGDKMQQMIREFETVLCNYSENQMKGIDSAIGFLVRKYSLFEIDAICPYIAKRLGLAEWIVRGDIRQRYRRINKKTIIK